MALQRRISSLAPSGVTDVAANAAQSSAAHWQMRPMATGLEMLAPLDASPTDEDDLAVLMSPQLGAPVALVVQVTAAGCSPKHTTRLVELASVEHHCYSWLVTSQRLVQSYEARLPLSVGPSRWQYGEKFGFLQRPHWLSCRAAFAQLCLFHLPA